MVLKLNKVKTTITQIITNIDLIPTAILLIDEETHKVVDLNSSCEKMIGLPKEKVIGLTCYNNFCPEQKGLCPFTNLIKEVKSYRTYLIKTNGEKIRVLKTVTPVILNGNRYLMESISDISEYSGQTEDIIEGLKEQKEILFNLAPDAYYISDLKGTFIEGNKAAEELIGYRREYLVGKSFLKLKLLPAYQIPKAAKLLVKNALGKATGPDEFTIVRKDGKKIEVEIRTYPVKIKDGTVVLGIARDIGIHKNLQRELKKANYNLELKIHEATKELNKRIKAEKKLLESKEEYMILFDTAPDGIVTLDKKGMITSCNIAVTNLSGYSKDELIGKHFTKAKLFLAEDIPRYIKIFSIILGGKKAKPFKITIKSKNRDILFGEAHVGRIKKDSKTVGFQVVVRDVTQNIKDREELEESEKRFKILSEATTEGILIHDKFKAVDGNKNLAKMIGIKHSEGIGQNLFKFVTPETKIKALKNMLIKNHKPYEGKAIRKDGTTFPIEICARSIPFKGKKARVVSIRDLTSYKEAENVIRESEKKFKELSDMLPEMVFEIDVKGDVKYTNKLGYKIFGYTKKDVDRGLNIFKLVYEKDHSRLKKRIENESIIENGKGRLNEYTAIKKGGKRFPVEIHSNVVMDEKGKVIGLRGILIDITERKKAEDKLKKSYAKLQKTLDGTINTLASIIETRDPYTSGHQKRVSKLATAIANKLGLETDNIGEICTAALIHDIGKINIPDSILSKPGKISDIEFDMIKTHPQVGYDIIKNIEFSNTIKEIVLQHHERENGSGYPNGLKGKDIVLGAKILAVVDVVEAMSSHRPYRPALGIDKALKEIAKDKGKLYDPKVVEACIRLIAKKKFKF